MCIRDRLIDVESFSLLHAPSVMIHAFLKSNGFSATDIDLVLYSNSSMDTIDELHALFKEEQLLDYQKITGCYFTNSAFALDYGIDMLLHKNELFQAKKDRTILVYNNLIPENLGLILLQTDNK